ncbi:flagellar export chaperone FliS [Desulfonatronovibrio hydrogenovorans]|uniref:flagellar export chaperone FliS n=1 Tax=Desulfonatronovibrio hydrogenovorans TaxID=53245 RepID=UPI00054FEF71|nr:flagellar export chaperone FliS [Desulfonatronovibrio hydrogenovorans]
MYSSAAKAYFKTKVNTTSQEEIVVLLFEAAIKFLEQSKIKIQEKDFQEKGNLISKALDVIAELDASLNAEKGGELAQNLHALYLFCQSRLLMANLKMDTEIIDEVITMLKKIGSAFAEIIQSSKLK